MMEQPIMLVIRGKYYQYDKNLSEMERIFDVGRKKITWKIKGEITEQGSISVSSFFFDFCF